VFFATFAVWSFFFGVLFGDSFGIRKKPLTAEVAKNIRRDRRETPVAN
jgi:hypothetical protein